MGGKRQGEVYTMQLLTENLERFYKSSYRYKADLIIEHDASNTFPIREELVGVIVPVSQMYPPLLRYFGQRFDKRYRLHPLLTFW